MALAATRRERVFLFLAIFLGIVAIAYNFGIKGGVTALADEREQLGQERSTYEDYIEQLRREPLVEKKIEEMRQRYPFDLEEAGKLTALIEKELKVCGMAGTNIGASQEEVVEDAEDYGFLTLTITCSGDVKKVARMLNFFDAQAILVKELRLTGRVDNPTISVDVTVSRLVELSEEKKAELKKKADEARGRSRRVRRRAGPGI